VEEFDGSVDDGKTQCNQSINSSCNYSV